MKPSTVQRCVDAVSFSRAAADAIVERARDAVRERGLFSLVLSGGRAPRPVYERLAECDMPWQRVHLFFGDERCVPPDDIDSNYRQARESLLDCVAITEENIHRMRGELPPQEGADAYERELRSFFGGTSPSFDLILLGLGSDGHTASLFPGDPACDERERWVVATPEPTMSPGHRRITLTLPVLNAAREVFFLSGEKGKEEVLRAILDDRQAATAYFPAARVAPHRPARWFILGN